MAKDISEKDVKELDRLSMWSKPKNGRPLTWTPEAIEKFGEEFVEWAQKDTSLVLASFVAEKLMNPQILTYLADLSPKFSEALKTAKRLIGARREIGAITKKYEPKVYGMSQRMYDPEYDAYRLLELEREELIKAKAKIKALQQELSDKGEIRDFIESQKIITKVTE